MGVSFKPINTDELNTAIASSDPEAIRDAKHTISLGTVYGYEVADTTFPDLGNLLQGDFAYSPFKFRNGTRGKENVAGGTKWVVLDIDDSAISASETHFMLSDINHHVALSSDPNNEFKFRVLLELDSVVELSPIAWKHFYLSIANDLALKADPLPQSQIFFSYADRPIISNLDASPLESRPYIIQAKEHEANKEHREKQLTPNQKQAYLNDELETFAYAFNADNGTGSRNIYRMMQHAKSLGATLEETLALIDSVNEWWEMPMHEERIETLKEQCRRLY